MRKRKLLDRLINNPRGATFQVTEDFVYPMIIYPAEEGGYVAEIPALKGCLAQGETLLECLQELKTVETLWLESARRNKRKIPGPDEANDKTRKRVA